MSPAARHSSFYRRRGKRWFDLAASTVALVIGAPVLLALWVAVRIGLGKPALFRQTRAGLDGGSFDLVKFRSMTDERSESGELLPDSNRLTGLGSALRSTSLDELPELVNIFRGDMSLVGPRPLLPQYLAHYSEEQARRHEAVPGLTGWAQVQGRNSLSWSDQFALDVWYVDNVSLALDLKILLATVRELLISDGTRSGAAVTKEEFRGSEV